MAQLKREVSMPKRKPISKTEQRRRFEQAAREAGVDTSPGTLEHIVRQIAKAPPNPTKSTKAPHKK